MTTLRRSLLKAQKIDSGSLAEWVDAKAELIRRQEVSSRRGMELNPVDAIV